MSIKRRVPKEFQSALTSESTPGQSVIGEYAYAYAIQSANNRRKLLPFTDR